jgi:DNA mismatch endonuclease Vsr
MIGQHHKSACSCCFCSGNPWNKGKTKNDDVRILQYGKTISQSLKGRKLPQQIRKKISNSIKRYITSHPEALETRRMCGKALQRSGKAYRRRDGEFKHTEEIKRLISIRTKEAMKKPDIRNKCRLGAYKTRNIHVSHIEKMLSHALSYAGINLESQYSIRDQIIIDLAEPLKKVAIFVEGCWWHCCPTHFPNPTSKIQRRNLWWDQKKFQILEALGWKVIRIWEHEIQESIQTCVAKIKEVLNCYTENSIDQHAGIYKPL